MTLREDWVDSVGQQVDAAFLNQVGAEVNANTAAVAGKQAGDSDLTAIAALTPTDNDVLQRKSGAWTNRTPSQLKADLAVSKSDVGLGSVDNVSAASLRDRSTHTGSQTSSTISDLTEAVQDIVGALLSGTTGVTVNYNDAANTLTISGLGDSSATAETIRDTIGVALTGTGLISVTANDALDTITISTTATANDTDANLKNRANHTGTQSADTVVDGSTNKAYTAAEKTKLTGIATGATANSSDATLLARGNHTGTQTASTISDFAAGVVSADAGRRTAVSNVTSLTVNVDTTEYVEDTGITGNVTINNPTGTPGVGQRLWVSLTGTAARTISYGTAFEDSTVTRPTTTVTTARLDIGFVWNTATSKWRCVASA